MKNIEKITDEIFSSEEYTEEFKNKQNLDEVVDFYRKFDKDVSYEDVTEYLIELFELDKGQNGKLSEEELHNVSGGKAINRNRMLASFLGGLTALGTSFGVGSPKASAESLWSKMSTTEKVVTTSVAAAGVAATGITLGFTIYERYKLNKLRKEAKGYNKKIDIDNQAIKYGKDPVALGNLKIEYRNLINRNNALQAQLRRIRDELQRVTNEDNVTAYMKNRLQSEHDRLVKDIAYLESLPEDNRRLERNIEDLKNRNSDLEREIRSLELEKMKLELKS